MEAVSLNILKISEVQERETQLNYYASHTMSSHHQKS